MKSPEWHCERFCAANFSFLLTLSFAYWKAEDQRLWVRSLTTYSCMEPPGNLSFYVSQNDNFQNVNNTRYKLQ